MMTTKGKFTMMWLLYFSKWD